MSKTKDDKTMNPLMSFKPSTLETIDYAVYNWLNDEMKIFCTTNKGWKKVPTVWVAGERAWQTKNHKNLRDNDGALIFPIMTLERKGFSKDLSRKGTFWGNIFPVKDKKRGSITIARKIQQDKTANFANAISARKSGPNGTVGNGQLNYPTPQNKKIVYETISIPMPSYVDVNYEISVRTEYQQQMNEVIQPFVSYTGGVNYFLINSDGHQYESFVQSDFSESDNLTGLEEETRIYETKITIKVLGYLIGADKNNESPNIVVRENAVEIKIPRERVITKDEPEWPIGKYRS